MHLLFVCFSYHSVYGAWTLKKLRSLTVKKTFSPIKTGMIPIKKKLEEDLGKAKEEVAEADKMWEDLNGTAKSKVYAE